MSLRVLSPRVVGCCALLMLSAPIWAQTTVPAASAVTSNAQPALPEQLQDFGAYVDSVRKQFDVPGIAVAIVKDGQVVLEQGSGVRELGKPAAVDAHTLFAIASNTKAFTAASLQMLAEEGKVNMDGRVIDYLPWFQMSDPYVTHEMRVRDLLAHRSGLGLGAGDLLYWPPTGYSTKEVVQRLRYVPLATSFRSAYAYDNILYAVATLVIEKVSGQSYADFIRTRIFKPVGMNESLVDMTDLKPGMDVATGHAKFNFTELKPVPPMAWSNNSGAGGIYASVHDMARWMNVQLAGGKLPDGRALFSEDSQKQMWSMLTPIKISEPSVPELNETRPNFSGYGEGWSLADYQGHRVVSHTGGWPGMVSRVALMPELKLGVVVLTNQESGAAFNAVTYRVLDAYLGRDKKDWVAAYAASVKKSKGNADDSWKQHEAARDKHSKPSLPLAEYAGTFRDPWYGDIVVSQQGGKLRMVFSKTAQLSGTMEPWQHDTFIVRWDDRSLNADAFVSYALDADGKVRDVRMQSVSPLTDFSFDFQDLRLSPVKSSKSSAAN